VTIVETDPVVAPALAALAEDGLCVVPDVLSSAEVEAARQGLREISEAPGPHDKPHRHRHLTNNAPIFRQLVEHPLALRIVESVLGHDCVLNSMTERTLLPAAKAQQPHRDTDIWGPSLPWLPVASGINVIWPLDAFTPESGVTAGYPGATATTRRTRVSPTRVPARWSARRDHWWRSTRAWSTPARRTGAPRRVGQSSRSTYAVGSGLRPTCPGRPHRNC
jgi:ectoine hydroxylase-related dioxygenase (phytanoyl-CoA dioxygenase family)